MMIKTKPIPNLYLQIQILHTIPNPGPEALIPNPNRSQDHVLLEKTVLCISRIFDHFSNNIIIMKF
jgi:hypothetical protein